VSLGEDDRELAARFAARCDEPAFAELYRRHTPALLGLARRLAAGRGAEAEELVQEAWARAAAALPSFRWASSLRTWLCGFIVNVWRERRRSEGQPSTDPAAEEEDPRPLAPVERIDLERAVAGLPDGYRAAIVLHDIEGFTHEEIAEQLGVEPGTSKSQLSRARRALRNRLAARPRALGRTS